MIYKYEMACKEAGLNEEQTKAIRRVFDREKKQLKRMNELQEEMQKKYGFEIYSFSELHGQDEEEDFDPMDPGMNLEDRILHQMDVDRLRELLAQLPEEDRELLLAYYDGTHGSKQAYLENMNLSRYRADYRVAVLIKELRARFFAD